MTTFAGPPSAPLPPLPDEIRRVLCVVAHPDDMEYGMSAAVSHWGRLGVEVAYLLLTGGEAGMKRPPEEAGPVRADEQRRACATVGVDQLTILGHPDGQLVYGLDLRRDIARQIRRFRPDTLLTASFDPEASWGLNQADHRAAGLAAVDAVRDADNRWVFRELADEEGLPPWHCRRILVGGGTPPTHAFEVDAESRAAAVASLSCHAAYLADLPWHPAPQEMLDAAFAGQGRRAGVGAAVLFRLYDLGG
jgi:LmbE family N-acetylglucosaminyl deacetylase